MSATNGKALPPAVVLGLGQNGLATIRALARMGVPVIGIDNDLEQPGAHTRYARKSHCPGFSTEGPELADHLMRLGAELGQKAVLFPSGDINLTVVSENRERLAAHFHIVLPSREVLRRILDKKVFYRFAQENDLLHDADIGRELGSLLPNAELHVFDDQFGLLRDVPLLVQRSAALLSS